MLRSKIFGIACHAHAKPENVAPRSVLSVGMSARLNRGTCSRFKSVGNTPLLDMREHGTPEPCPSSTLGGRS